MRKCLLIIIVFILKINVGFSQQDPDLHFAMYQYNNLIINPSYAGKTNDISFAGFFRKQWMGFTGAPNTGTFSIHAPIQNKNIGLGFHAINESIGLENHLVLSTSYAYHIHINKGFLSLGISAGIKQFTIDKDKLKLEDNTDEVYTGLSNAWVSNIGYGMHYKMSNFFAAFSITNLNQPRLKYNDNMQSTLRRHYYMKMGYKYVVDKTLDIKPMMLMSYQSNSPFQAYTSVIVEKYQAYWGGIGYRTGDAISAFFGMHLDKVKRLRFKEKITFGYAFEWTLNGLPSYNVGTHELMVLYNIHLKTTKNHNSKYRQSIE